MMNTIFAQIAERAEQDRLIAESEWRATVRCVAAGTANEKDVVATLKASGRALVDLQRDVDFQQHVYALYVTLAEWPVVEKAAQLVHQAAVAFHQRRQAHERALVVECQSLAVSQQVASAEKDRIVAAKTELEELLGEVVAWPEVAEVLG